MNERLEHPLPIRRILVALDASQSSLNAMNTAVELAARFKAEVLGLFVEDINLLRLAELPFAREISIFSPNARRLRPLEMELQLRVQAARIRETLAHTAQRHGVVWDFRTARGAVGAEVLAAGAGADLVVLGKIGRSLPGLQRSGSTVRSLLMQRQGMTLILETHIHFAGAPVVVLYDGTETAQKALKAAAYLSRSHDAGLLIIVIGADPDHIERYRHTAALQARDLGADPEFRHMVRPGLSELAWRIRRESGGPVIIPCFEDWFEGEKLCGLVDEIANPVLLIR
ncbi:MAG: universal stress protein [Desulfosarcinaceae bacterium]